MYNSSQYPENGNANLYQAQSNYAPPPYMNQQPLYPPLAPAQSTGNGMAVAGLVLGIIGMLAWLLPIVGLPTAIVGIILAARGRNALSGRTMATVGLVLSIIALAFALINAAAGAYMATH
jgi:hypothetical protein